MLHALRSRFPLSSLAVLIDVVLGIYVNEATSPTTAICTYCVLGLLTLTAFCIEIVRFRREEAAQKLAAEKADRIEKTVEQTKKGVEGLHEKLDAALPFQPRISKNQRVGSADHKLIQPARGKFLGRQGPLAEILRRLESGQSLSVCPLVKGSGGIGKTELCKAVLRQWLTDRPGFPVYFVEALGAESLETLCSKIGLTLGHRDILSEENLLAILPDGDALFYLDNLESVAADTRLPAFLTHFSQKPGIRLLASSRESIAGWPDQLPLGRLEDPFDVQLFVEKWNAARPAEPLSENDGAVKNFVKNDLGSHALAIELEAALGKYDAFQKVVARWQTDGVKTAKATAQAKGKDFNLEKSLGHSLDRLANLSQNAPKGWVVAAFFPDGMGERAIGFFENEARLFEFDDRRLLLDLSISEPGDGLVLLPPIARFALDHLADGAFGLSEKEAFEALSPFFEKLVFDENGNEIRPGGEAPYLPAVLAEFSAIARFLTFFIKKRGFESPVGRFLGAMNNFFEFEITGSLGILQALMAEKGHFSNLVIARATDRLGDLESRLGAVDSARRRYDEAILLFEKEQADLGKANALKSLGDLESRLGAVDSARRRYDEAIRLFEKEQDDLGKANALQSLGDLERRLGAVDSARRRYDEAIRLFEKEQSDLGKANALQSLGDLESRLGQVDSARRRYDEAILLYEKEQADLGKANALQSLGDLESRLGAVDSARRRYDEAILLFEKEQADLGKANALQSLGDLESRLGAVDSARRRYDEAILLFEKEQADLGKANALQSLGNLESRLGAVDSARRRYDEAILLFEKEQHNLGKANVLQSLGDLELAAGKPAEAVAIYLKANVLYEKEQDPTGIAYTCAELVRAFHQLGKMEEIEAAARQGLEAGRASGVPNVLDYVQEALVEVGLIDPADFQKGDQ